MRQKGPSPNLVACTTLIDAFSKARLPDRARSMCNEMVKEGCRPDLLTFKTLIYGYMRSWKPIEAEELLIWMLDEGYSADQAILGELVNELCKVNEIDKAFKSILR
jgi:pentatricopeptide repeat protein